MPELTTIQLGLLALMLIVGVVLGWVFRSDRTSREKIALNAGWQEQIESQYEEKNRLIEQNKTLMEQINQLQVSNSDLDTKTRQLAASLNEATELGDDLQRQLQEKDDDLKVATVARDRLRVAMESRQAQIASAKTILQQKEDKIARLNRELASWHSRLPPLVARFRARNQDAEQLESELQDAKVEIERLAGMTMTIQASIDPADNSALPDGLDASNDPLDEPADETGITEEVSAASDTGLPEEDSVEPVDDPPAPFHETVNDLPVPNEGNDDLKQIKGIGPAIEKKLNDLGVFSFAQIAGMSEYEIDRVAQQLKGFRSRIYRENWLGQARDLQYQKSSNPT